MLRYALCRASLSNSHYSLPSFSSETPLTDAILLTSFLQLDSLPGMLVL